jgi:hypothetical protein
MVRFIYRFWFRIAYLILGILAFLYVISIISFENIRNPWFLLFFYVSFSFLIHGIFSLINNGFQNASVYLFGAVSWVIALIFTSIGYIGLLLFVLIVLLLIQVGLFNNQAPDREKI